MDSREGFSKPERLHSSKRIEEVFSKGKSFVIQPFRVVYLLKRDTVVSESQVLFSVAKKNIHLAVRRNRVKRLMKEAYRRNRHQLLLSIKEKRFSLFFCILYLGNELPLYDNVEDKIKSILQRLSHLDEDYK